MDWRAPNLITLANMVKLVRAFMIQPLSSLVARAAPADPPSELYVLTGPLYERMMPSMPMPNSHERHRLPSAYWKVLATPDGRMAAFIFDQETPRSADYCAMRTSLEEVEIRADLELFPRLPTRTFSDLSPDLGCPALPAPPTPE